LYNHYLANKAYFSAITVKNIYESFTHKMATKASWHRNYVTVTLCINTSRGEGAPVVVGDLPVDVDGVVVVALGVGECGKAQLVGDVDGAQRLETTNLLGVVTRARRRVYQQTIAQRAPSTRNYSAKPVNCRILYGHYLPTVILIIIGIPSPTDSFIPGLKPSFSANPSHRSLSFSSSGLTRRIPQTVYCYF